MISKTDEQNLDTIEELIPALQAFVDKHIVGSNAMTASAVYEAFCKENACDLDEDSFVKGFRAAVRFGKVKGIESARRWGYRRIGFEAESTVVENASSPLEPFLEDLQKYVDNHIVGDVKMTAWDIYTGFSKHTSLPFSKDDFIKLFRSAIKEGAIKGIECAYRFGYKRSGEASEEAVEEKVEKTGYESCEITIDSRRKIVALDRLNWGYQVRRDSGSWYTEAYFSSTENMLRCLAARLLDDEIKGMDRHSIKELQEKVVEAENNLASLLVKILDSKSAAA